VCPNPLLLLLLHMCPIPLLLLLLGHLCPIPLLLLLLLGVIPLVVPPDQPPGCKTGLSGFVTACVVGLVLLCMTPVFEKLPMNAMGAIVISGVSGLLEYEQAVHLFKVKPHWAARGGVGWGGGC